MGTLEVSEGDIQVALRAGGRGHDIRILAYLGNSQKISQVFAALSPEMQARVIPLGGMGEIGKNLYLYEYQETIILVDCGLAFPDETTLGVDIIIPDITYLRDPQHWARDLNVRRGSANFDRILVKIYKDNTARLEALKAGEFDLMRFFSAGDWARRVNGKRFDSGELVKKEFAGYLGCKVKNICIKHTS